MRTLVVMVAVVILLAALKLASSVVVPLLLATTLTIAFQPVSEWLARHRTPPIAAVAVTAVGALTVVAGAGLLLYIAAADLALSLPRYEAAVLDAQAALGVWLDGRGMAKLAVSVRSADPMAPTARFVESGLWQMSAVVQTLFLVLLITVFMQLEAAAYRRKLSQLTDGPRHVRQTAAALKDVQRFLLMKVALSVSNGVLLGLWCWAWGVPSPLLWGILAFALNFIPFVGSIMAAIPPVLLALIGSGVGGALGVLAGYLLVNLLVDNILEPRLMGHALGLSPLVILLSMLLWGFLLGAVGALLSVPLTMAVKIALSHSPNLRWVANILGHVRPLPYGRPADELHSPIG